MVEEALIDIVDRSWLDLTFVRNMNMLPNLFVAWTLWRDKWYEIGS